jgi:hypothetical protein
MRLPRLDALKNSRLARTVFGEKSSASLPDTQVRQSRWQAVSVDTGWTCCAASRELEGRYFLVAEAPALPLPGCDEANCECAYRHHADRRQAARRDDDMGLSGLGLRPADERRRGRDRRAGKSPEAVTDYFAHVSSARGTRSI